MKDTLEVQTPPVLLKALWDLLIGAAPYFGQERVFRRAVALVFAELFAFGRHTVTQLLRVLGVVHHDWSAWYRIYSKKRFKEERLGGYVFTKTLPHVPETEPYATTVDAVITPRSGKKVAGSSWWLARHTAAFRRGLERGQRFVEVSWLTPDEESYRRAIPLRWIPAVTAKAIPSDAAPLKEWEAGLQALKWVREQLNAAGRVAQRLVGILDGSYDVQGIWKDVPENTTLLIRCAKNQALYKLPEPQAGPRGRGAPHKYGPRELAPKELIRYRKQLRSPTLRIRGLDRHLKYRVVGPVLVEGAPNCPLFLILVGGHTWHVGKRSGYREPVYYLVNVRWEEDH